jgi:hypothetical protein
LNTENPNQQRDEAIIDPFRRFDVMSYCGVTEGFSSRADKWPSKFTYTNLINGVSQRAPRSPVQLLALRGDFLLVSGSINLKQQTALLRPFGKLVNGVPPPDPVPGPYTLQLRNAAGAVLASVDFLPSVPEPEPGFVPDRGSFMIAVPANAAYQQAVVLGQGAVLASRNASPNPPAVEVLFPNGAENLVADNLTLKWKGTDPDGDALSYVVQFSPDGGTSWETLAVNWTQES